MSDELVELGDIATAALEVKAQGTRTVVEKIAQVEPSLVGFVEGSCRNIAGGLALAGAPSTLAQQVCEDVRELVAIVILATQRGSHRVWVNHVPKKSPLAREFIATFPSPSKRAKPRPKK